MLKINLYHLSLIISRCAYFVPVDYSNILYLFPKDDKLNNLPQQKQDIK